MKIFEVNPDSNNIQGLEFDRKVNLLDEAFVFSQAKTKLEFWKKDGFIPNSKVFDPENNKSDFYSFLIGELTFNEKVKRILEPLLSSYCEFLPRLLDNSETIYTLNILEPVDCFDYTNSEYDTWYFEKLGKELIDEVDKWAFVKEKLDPQKVLFKVSGASTAIEMFCFEGLLKPEEEFKHIIESNGFTGLRFNEVWSDE